MPTDEKWTPDKPIPEKEDEEDCQREARARARVKFLESEHLKPVQPTTKKRRGVFSRNDD